MRYPEKISFGIALSYIAILIVLAIIDYIIGEAGTNSPFNTVVCFIIFGLMPMWVGCAFLYSKLNDHMQKNCNHEYERTSMKEVATAYDYSDVPTGRIVIANVCKHCGHISGSQTFGQVRKDLYPEP